MPTIDIFEAPEDAAERAARLIAEAVRAKPTIVLGLATGETMRPVYAALVADHRRNATSWRGVTVFNLDDYVGLPADHPASFSRFMRETLFDHIDIASERCWMPDGMAPDLAQEARAYEARIAAAGGIDLQLLGIGSNGHIAFNEPGSDFAGRTRVVALAQETRAAAALAFAEDDDVPRYGLTLGIGTILQARRIVLVATGAGKARAVAKAFGAPADVACPASALQAHADVTVLLDAAAAAGLAPG